MALKNLFDMVKADRYTADGREAIIKAQEEETEDKVYQIGEISQKTGLQKTANGWVKPKNGKQPGAKKEESKADPKSLAGTPMKKADLNSKDPYEITYSMKPDTASEAKEMDKISAFMQEETGATLRNAITARESFYKNTKNPTPEQQEGLAALMKIQQKLGYGKPAEGPALNGQKKTVSHQEYRDGPMYGPAGTKTNKPNPNGVVAQHKQKLEAEKHEAARRDAQAPSKKTEVNTPGLRKDVQEAIKRSTPEEIKAYIKELRTPGSRMSRYFDNPDLLANVYEDELKKATENRPAEPEMLSKVSHDNLDVARNEMNTTPEEDQMLDYFVTEMHEDGTGLDEIIKRQDGIYERSNGAYPKEEKTYKSLREKIMNHYAKAQDAAPRVLTGDTRIRVRKA